TTVLFDAIAQAGWRTSIDALDRAPGLQAVGGGGQIFLGLSWGSIGPAIGGRARAGSVSGVGGVRFVEAASRAAVQMQLGERVRLRLGAEGGAAFLGSTSAWYAGGFVDGTFDVVQLGGGRAAVVFDLRVDLDGYLVSAPTSPFPGLST